LEGGKQKKVKGNTRRWVVPGQGTGPVARTQGKTWGLRMKTWRGEKKVKNATGREEVGGNEGKNFAGG